MPINFKTAVVVKNEVITSTYHDLVFETDYSFNFSPGQFITVRINEKVVRSYSIAGKLNEKQFGLLVDIKPGGPGSHYFEALKPGDRIEYLGPAGSMVLKPEDGAEEVVFLGTGSGIAPLKAMLEEALYSQPLVKKMTLYFGVRHTEDIFWNHYFDAMAARHENLTFKLCLSKPDETWQGAKGHITDLLKEDYPEDTSKLAAYMCGNGKMIDEVKAYLGEHGTPVERIYHEKFF